MRLLALRHGQASFHAEDYDQLSELGFSQCQAAGDWLGRHGEQFVQVVRGGLRRHGQSLDALRDGFGQHGATLPDAEVDADLDEFDHRAVVAAYLRRQAPDRQALDSPAEMVRMLRAALQSWARGELDDDAEPWAHFRTRTRRAGARLLARASRGPTLLISSAGVLAQLAAEAMQAPDQRAVELNMQIRNAAMVELEAAQDGWRLASWNALPHLAHQRSWWTYL